MLKTNKLVLIAIALYLQGCASSTMIVSRPAGAKVFVDGEYAGVTPYEYKDSKIVFSKTAIKLSKQGYKPLTASFTRSEEVKVLPLVLGIPTRGISLLWVMGYKPAHTYELEQDPEAE